MATTVDSFTVDVLRNAFASIVDEMGVMLSRCAMSPVITQGRDFSGAVTTATGDLVMQGAYVLPGHVGTMPFTVQSILEDFADDIQPGDVFVTNDPHRAGTHLPDIRMIKPIFADGRLLAFLINLGHFTDVGGALPGSFVANAFDCLAEGLLMPPVKFVRGGIRDDQILNIFLRNCRLPDLNRADLLALVASLDLGESRFEQLIDKYGAETLLAAFEHHIDSNTEALRALVRDLPDGSYSLTDYIDRDPGAKSDEPILCKLTLTVAGDSLVFDFSESAPAARGAVNGTLPVTTSGVINAIKCIYPQLELCAGINRAIEIRTTPGSILHSLWPSPTSGLSGSAFQKVVDLVFGCFAEIVPERVMACPATETNYVQYGDDPRDDSLFDQYILYVWTEGGYGARATRDNGVFMTLFASGSMNQSVELYEQLYPIVWERMELVADSGGPGRQRGGLGDVRRVRLAYGETAVLSSFGDRERFPAWGLFGGKHGRNQGFVVNPGTAEEVSIGVMTTGYDVVRGDTWDYWSGGGGGFGDPLERDPANVLEDVKDGYVSVEGARRDYGVIVETQGLVYDAWRVDSEATRILRAEMSAARSGRSSA
jgi:N-methylhydantoinase B